MIERAFYRYGVALVILYVFAQLAADVAYGVWKVVHP